MNLHPCPLLLVGSLVLLAVASIAQAQPTTAPSAPLVCGADRTDEYVPSMKDKRVAILANQTSTIGGKPSVDVLLEKGVKVVKLFGPEHGFRGNASNGTVVADEIDSKTGLPIISLYGKKRKPDAKDLADVDVLIFDVQDVGVRFYTKINTLRDVMDACAAHNVEMLLLDRPNPNGYLIDGPILEEDCKSGIGQFPIPIAHGMTLGEFAQMINGEGWLTTPGVRCKLRIVPVANYTHDTPYTLPVPPSPNLASAQAILLYPSMCWFEGTILNHGRGTRDPFTMIGAPALKGIYPFSYTPVSIPGMAEDPVHQDQVCYGLDLRTYDTAKLRASGKLNLTWLMELYAAYPDKARFFDQTFHRQIGNFDFRTGTKAFRQQIIDGVPEEEIRKTWEPGLAAFKETRKKYLLYP